MICFILLNAVLTSILGSSILSESLSIHGGRIVGGEDANIEDLPWQVSVTHYGYHKCGGAIISETKIMSAAHCFQTTTASALAVRAGSSRKSSGGISIPVSEPISHPNFDENTMDYDYAVLKLVSSLKFGPGIQSIPLPALGQAPKSGSDALISGWGALSEGGPSSEQLQKVVVPVVDHQACQDGYWIINTITEKMFCAGVPEGGMDSCSGDSGGPVVVDGVLAGVVSWGYGCARPQFPGVFSDLSTVRDWIDSQ